MKKTRCSRYEDRRSEISWWTNPGLQTEKGKISNTVRSYTFIYANKKQLKLNNSLELDKTVFK